MRTVLVLLLSCLAAPLAAQTPIAEVVCAPTPDMKARLTGQYGSTITASGLRNPEEVMEVWSDDTGEWAMVIRYSSGRSCIVAMGEYWQHVAEKAPS